MAFTSCTRVLIVEDDALLAAHMESVVEDLGYEVVGPSPSFNAALETAQRDELDFVLLDFNLEQGRTAAPIAHTLAGRGIPFAFTTASCPAAIRALFSDAPIISKPVDDDELLDLLP